MNLTYNVLIIEDQEQFYDDYVECLKDVLDENGYILCSKRIEKIDELKEIKLDEIDLFLVDLKFGREDKGKEFIDIIRMNLLTDLLFYSSDANAINKYMISKDLQGVYFAVRDEHTNEVIPLIKKLMKKVIQRSNTAISTRGIVLGCIAEIDSIIIKKIKIMYEQLAQDKKIEVCKKAFLSSLNKLSNDSKSLKDFYGCDFVKEILLVDDVDENVYSFDLIELTNRMLLTNSRKNEKILLHIYELLRSKDKKHNEIKSLFDKLLSDRNVLAHSLEEVGEHGIIKFNYQESTERFLELTSEKCKELRKDICKYYELINDLK